MKIALSGATGFLGKYIVNYLVSLNHEVTVLSRNGDKAEGQFDSNVLIYETKYNYEHLNKLFKEKHVVIHLAAETMQRDTNPYMVSSFLQANLVTYENVLRAAKDASVAKVIFASTNNVYSSDNKIPFTENQNAKPSTVYGLSKLYADELGEYISKKTASTLTVVSLRLARLFGYGERDTVVFTKFMNLAVNKQTLSIFGTGETKIDYLYVKDAVSAIEKCLSEDIKSGIYNLGSNNAYSVREIAEIINQVSENNENLSFKAGKGDVSHLEMDSTKFYNEVDWKPKWSLSEAVKDYYNTIKK